MKINTKTLFLSRLFQEWPIFFYVCCVFILGTLISAFIIGQSVTPFFVFQMYSQPIPNAGNGSVNRIYVNHQELNTFKLYQETGDIIRSNTERFIYLKENNFKDRYYDKLKEISLGRFIPEFCYEQILTLNPIGNQTYANWLKDYLQNFYDKPITNIIVKKLDYNYQSAQLPVITKDSTLLNADYE